LGSRSRETDSPHKDGKEKKMDVAVTIMEGGKEALFWLVLDIECDRRKKLYVES